MTLISIDTGKPITRFPFKEDFATLRKRLAPAEFDAAVARINELIDAAGGQIVTAGWLPGSNWSGTVFNPIFTIGARKDYQQAAKLFGLLVWYVITERPERWGSGRYQKDGKDLSSRTYFKLPDR